MPENLRASLHPGRPLLALTIVSLILPVTVSAHSHPKCDASLVLPQQRYPPPAGVPADDRIRHV